jgi:fructose-1,6-bisphosphatase/inositol monophosphatase family enzyme/8-oxo-dGTP pyrophosphatase MutT (NUDIX family)
MKVIDFIIFNKENNRLYIQKRSKDRKLFPDKWETPGGHLEENETIIECIRRELKEETNLELDCVYGKVHDFIWDDKLTSNSVYLISASGNIEVEKNKISNFLWISRNELYDLIKEKNDIFMSYSNVFDILESKELVKNNINQNIRKWLHDVQEISNYYFKNIDLTIDHKDDGTPVSIADKKIETYLNNEISKIFPDHNFIGEEGEYAFNEKNRFKWVVDPIDGTRSFIVGRPTFGVLISLVYDNVPIFGCIFQPFTNELWSAFLGEDLLYNDKFFKLINTFKPNNNIETFTSAPEVFENIFDSFVYNNLKKVSKRLSYNGDCYAYGLLSLGFVDLIVEKELDSHDYCALIPILCSSNILFFSWDGIPIDYSSKKTSVISFKSYNFEKLISVVKDNGN